MKYLDLLFNIVKTFPSIQIMVLSLFTICSIIILVVGFIILLENYARPSIPQYRFSMILDRIIPLFILLMPLILVFTFNTNIAYFGRFCISILLHCLIIVPLMWYWSYLRNWGDIQESPILYWSWSHPRVYKDLSIALIYPLIFGLYFSRIV